MKESNSTSIANSGQNVTSNETLNVDLVSNSTTVPVTDNSTGQAATNQTRATSTEPKHIKAVLLGVLLPIGSIILVLLVVYYMRKRRNATAVMLAKEDVESARPV